MRSCGQPGFYGGHRLNMLLAEGEVEIGDEADQRLDQASNVRIGIVRSGLHAVERVHKSGVCCLAEGKGDRGKIVRLWIPSSSSPA